MAIKVNSNFEFQSKTYGDVKKHFDTIADMAAYNPNVIPNGFITFVDEVNCNYQWLDINEVDPVLNKWRKFTTSDGASIDDTLESSTTKTYSIDKIKSLIDKCGGFIAVDALPDISTDEGKESVDIQKIYLVPSANATEGNTKDEYVCIYTKGTPDVMREALITDEADYNAYKAEIEAYVTGGGSLTDDFATYTTTNTTTAMTADTYAEMVESINASDTDFAAYTARVTAEVITPATDDTYAWEHIGSISSGNLVFDEFTPNNAIGKVKAGQSLLNKDVLQVLKDMLSVDVEPTLKLTGTPVATTVYEKGTSIADVTLNAVLTVGTAEFADDANVIFKKNGVAIDTQPYVVGTLGYTYTDTGANLDADTTYSVELAYTLSGDAATLTDKITYKFAYPIFYGVSTVNTGIDATTLTKIVSDKTTQTVSYSANNAYCVLAVPDTKTVSSLKDVNGFENIDSWSYTTEAVTIGADPVVYKVYVSNTPVTCTDFAYTAKLV